MSNPYLMWTWYGICVVIAVLVIIAIAGGDEGRR